MEGLKRKLEKIGPAKSKPKKALVKQAPALTLKQWALWLQWLCEHAGPCVYLAVFFTGAFGLRCSESLGLKRADICLDAAIPKIKITGEASGARKSPGDVYVRTQHMKLMRRILKDGIRVQRVKKHKHGKGAKRLINYEEFFAIPASGYIFKARANATHQHLHYIAIYHHVRRQAPLFEKHLATIGEPVSSEVGHLRPHSGRATLITELMGEGLTTAMSMKYARHSPASHKVHLRYGRLTLADVKESCDRLSGSKPKTKWSALSTKVLLASQAAINKELQTRLHKAQ